MALAHKFEVEKEIFEALPNLKIFVATVRDIDLNLIDKDGIKKLLHQTWTAMPLKAAKYGEGKVQDHPNVRLWRSAFEHLGISVKKFSSSIENLFKRASKPESKVLEINPLVDYYNALSLKHIVPFGAFDLDSPICRDLKLRFTHPDYDTFQALDENSANSIPGKEAVYAYQNTVVTRHINWKQSKEGLLTHETKNVVFMAELLDEKLVDALKEDFITTCRNLLMREPHIFILEPSNPYINLSY